MDGNAQDWNTEGSTEPADLASAYQMVRGLDQTPTENNVEAPEAGEPATFDQGAGNLGTPVSNEIDTSNIDTDGDDRGPANNSQGAYDFTEQSKALRAAIDNQANINTRKWLNEQKYEHISVNQLARKDENSGDIYFVNPDESGRKINRKEAQEWVDAFNRQIDDEARKYARGEQQRLLKEQAPLFALYAFAPTLNTMSDIEVDVLNDILEPYIIRDKNGNLAGYRCNLNQAASYAKTIAARFMQRTAAKVVGTEEQPAPVNKPALDSRSHGTSDGSLGTSDNYDDITDLSQAMRLLQKQKREGNN